ncbi:uncharacterized protein LOC127710920 [Mytilus californianus]|uniref:uncharacterized protein LOC127710920 n=1 Tax=Mytilus californianus TaxID=6549 RepID=UPI002245C9E5|nr:uncharacterized protein LOC127710920 [Mytilus californianus]
MPLIGLLWLLAGSLMKTDSTDWKLVFKIDAKEKNNNVYDMFMDDGITYNINDNDAQIVNISNGKHFKSDIINYWKDIDIEQVKVVIYRDGLEQAFLHFNGSGTDKKNWFSQYGLLNSSYIDLKTASPGVSGYHFSIEGHKRRRFFVNKSFGGCQNDAGWLLVAEGGSCNMFYEPLNTLTILYSPTNIYKTMMDMFTEGYRADTLGFFVKFKASTCQPLTHKADICSIPVQLASSSYCYKLCNKSLPETNLQDKIQKLEKVLTVERKATSKYRRSITSAPDDRLSSQTMGLVGALCIALVVGFIVILDWVTICQKCSKANKVTTVKEGCTNEVKRGNQQQEKA